MTIGNLNKAIMLLGGNEDTDICGWHNELIIEKSPPPTFLTKEAVQNLEKLGFNFDVDYQGWMCFTD